MNATFPAPFETAILFCSRSPGALAMRRPCARNDRCEDVRGGGLWGVAVGVREGDRGLLLLLLLLLLLGLRDLCLFLTRRR